MVRGDFKIAGVEPAPPVKGGRRLPDGSLEITFVLDRDVLPQLEAWAEEAGATVEAQAREILSHLLTGYLYGDWSTPAAAAAVAAAPDVSAAAK